MDQPDSHIMREDQTSAREDLPCAAVVARWCILAIAALVPIFVTTTAVVSVFAKPYTADIFAAPKVALLLLLTSVALLAWVLAVVSGGLQVKLSTPYAALAGFLLLAAASTAFSAYPVTALIGGYAHREGLVTVAAYAVTAFLSTQLIRTRRDLWLLAVAITLSTSIAAVQGIIQYFGYFGQNQYISDPGRPFSTLGNPDFLGGLLVLGMPVVLALALSARNRIGRLASWLAFSVTAVAWIALSVRAAWIGGFLALAVMCAVAWRKRVRLVQVDTIPLAVGSMSVMAILLRTVSDPTRFNLVSRVASILDVADRNNAARLEIWKLALRVVADRPLFGVGLDALQAVSTRYESRRLVGLLGFDTYVDNAHNQVLSLAAAVGVPATILCVVFFVWAFATSSRRVLRREEHASAAALLYAGLWAGSVGFAATLAFSFTVPGNGALFFLACGVLLAPYAVTQSRALSKTVAGAATLAGVALAVAAVVFAVPLAAADNAYLNGITAKDGIARLEEYLLAVERFPLERKYVDAVALHRTTQFLAASSASLSDPGELANAKALLEPAVSSLEAAIKFTPDDQWNYVTLANVHLAAATVLDEPERYEDSIEAANDALALAPARPKPRVVAAMAYAALGDRGTAESLLEEAVDIDPAYADALRQLMRLRNTKGDD